MFFKILTQNTQIKHFGPNIKDFQFCTKLCVFEKLEVLSNMATVFFSNVSLKIPKWGNFGPKFKDSYFILLSVHELLSIFAQ